MTWWNFLGREDESTSAQSVSHPSVNIQKTTGKLHVFWGWATINGHVHLPFQFRGYYSVSILLTHIGTWWCFQNISHSISINNVTNTLFMLLDMAETYICLDGLKPPPRDDCAMVPNHFQDSPTPRLYLRSLWKTSFHIKCWGIFGKNAFSAMSKCGFRSKFPPKTRRSWILQRARNRSRGPLMNWPVFHLTIQNETRRPLASLRNPQFFTVGSPWFCFMF